MNKRKSLPFRNFNELRDICKQKGILFEDAEFPCEHSSVFFSQGPRETLEWKRPKDIVKDPRLIAGSAFRFNIQQGELGEFWLLIAVANLAVYQSLFRQVVPPDQDFEEDYVGLFHFRFWQYGKWIEVVIDDRLPTVDGKLAFLHSSQPNEFWSALLEKAYAKLYGSYEALLGGSTHEAMEDFTGGIAEMYDLNEPTPSNLFEILFKANERSSLMNCFIQPDPLASGARTPEGLVKGQAYGITRVSIVDIIKQNERQSKGRIYLIRLRNLWGNATEWSGPWSDESAEWNVIPDDEKQEMGLTYDHDGEFWMSYDDFVNYFDILNICNLNPDSLTEEESPKGKKWDVSVFGGEWVRGVTAGGCRNHTETFFRNPQYRITLTDADEDEEKKCTMIVALMQKNKKPQKHKVMKLLSIGFAVYHLENPDRLPIPLNFGFFKLNKSCGRSPTFKDSREVTSCIVLPPGVYCIIPSTFDPNEEGEFMLRVFTDQTSYMEVNDDDIGISEIEEKIIDHSMNKFRDKLIEEKSIRDYFTKYAGENNELSWVELQGIVNVALREEIKQSGAFGFSKDVCRSMIAMLDVNHSGKLGFEEFKSLWVDIKNWKGAFKLYAKSSSGELSTFELREALNSAGYRLSNRILRVLVHRYETKEGYITFDDFTMCAVKLKSMIDFYKQKDPDNSNSVSFSLEEWVEKSLYA